MLSMTGRIEGGSIDVAEERKKNNTVILIRGKTTYNFNVK